MKQFFKYFLASLLAILFGGALLFSLFFIVLNVVTSSFKQIGDSINKEKEDAIASKEILVVDLSQTYSEVGATNIMSILMGKKEGSLGLYDLTASIKEAKDDNNIKGIYVKTGNSSNAFATLQQIRDAIKNFKTSGKFVVAYGESMGQSDYFIASAADSVYIHPMGSVEIKGMASTLTFFKGAMDKFDVTADIFYCGQYKSATEPFRVTKMTEQNRAQIAAMQNDYWSELTKAISEFTKADSTTIYNWANNYTLENANLALANKVVTGIKYKDEVEAVLRKLTNKSESDKVPFVTANNYASSAKFNRANANVAILVAEGNIIDGTSNSSTPEIASDDFIKEIRKIKDNDAIKAVVIRVNSGGGSALASENILRELNTLRTKKPYVVSMGDYAASGGYYISSAADSIYAMPTTITGSIGVFGMMFSTTKLLNSKVGITFDTEKNTQYGDFPNMARAFTQRERDIIQGGVDSVYALFKRRVANGREMDVEYVDSVGQGRIWTGTQALQLGLVDALGGLDRAVAGVANIAGLSTYKVAVYPESDDQFSKILKMVSNAHVAENVMAEFTQQQQLGAAYNIYKFIQNAPKNKVQTYMYLPMNIEVK